VEVLLGATHVEVGVVEVDGATHCEVEVEGSGVQVEVGGGGGGAAEEGAGASPSNHHSMLITPASAEAHWLKS
jgi:hypothetical protein